MSGTEATLKDVRKARGLTCKQVAEHIRVTERQVFRIEAGFPLTGPMEFALADVYGLPVERIRELAGEKEAA